MYSPSPIWLIGICSISLLVTSLRVPVTNSSLLISLLPPPSVKTRSATSTCYEYKPNNSGINKTDIYKRPNNHINPCRVLDLNLLVPSQPH